MLSTHHDNIKQALEIAKAATPRRYILHSPNLDALRELKKPKPAVVNPMTKPVVSEPAQMEGMHPELQNTLSNLKASFSDTASNPIDHKENIIAKTPRFFTYGCHGSTGTHPEQVAKKLITDIRAAIAKGEPPEFVLLLGDNFYDFGVDSPDAPEFRTVFEHLFSELRELNIPIFLILGNHDENLHKKNKFGIFKAIGIVQGLNQVAYTYLPKFKFQQADLEQTYLPKNQTEVPLQLQNLPLWNMPSRFYSLDLGATEIFCIDSNTYANDYFEYQACLKAGRPPNPNNQAVWLERESARAKREGKNVIFAQHHPLITPGKRATDPDTHLYVDIPSMPLSDAARACAKERFPNMMNSGYCNLLKSIYEAQGLQPDLILNAHDHNMYHMLQKIEPTNRMYLREFCFGGGGGSIQAREQYSTTQKYMGAFLPTHGVGEIICDERLTVRMHTVSNAHCLEFNSLSKNPIRQYPGTLEERSANQKFSQCVQRAVDNYLSLGGSPGKGANRAHSIWAYISNKEAQSFVETVNTVKEKIASNYIFGGSSTSLITLLNAELALHYAKEFPKGVTIEEFANKVALEYKNSLRKLL